MAEEDIIFGKNRHFFGGIEPSNMKLFTVTADTSGGFVNGDAVIHAQIPDDTVVDGQTLCTVAGVVIRKSLDGYPKNEFDGQLVADITEKGPVTIVDENVKAFVMHTHYYAAFPYTTQGVYNRNPVNRASINTAWPLNGFKAVKVDDGIQLYFDESPLVGYLPITRVVVRRSTDHYPTSITDGDMVTEFDEFGSGNISYNDSNIDTGKVYYYSAFTFDEQNRSNFTTYSTASCSLVEYGYHFGYDLDTNDSDPSTRVTYPIGVDNAAYTPAKMDYKSAASDSVFSYGSWPNVAGEKFMPKPCVLGYDGTVRYYLNPNNYRYKEDGSTSSDITAESSCPGNVMMEWSKIWTKRWTDQNGIYHFRCSDVQIDADYECWCNYDKNNNQIPHFYTAVYPSDITTASMKALRSVSRSTMYEDTSSATRSLTYGISTERASINGSDWYITTMSDYLLIQDLLIMLGRSTDLKTIYGKGYVNTAASGANHGTTTVDMKGLFYGTDPTSSGITSISVKVFGMIDWWGYPRQFIAGWFNDHGVQRVKITRGTKDGSTAKDYNFTGDGYLTLNNTINTSGRTVHCETTPYGRIPVATDIDGDVTKYDCDWLTSGLSVLSPARVYYASSYYGIDLSLDINTASSITGARLSCKPSLKSGDNG